MFKVQRLKFNFLNFDVAKLVKIRISRASKVSDWLETKNVLLAISPS